MGQTARRRRRRTPWYRTWYRGVGRTRLLVTALLLVLLAGLGWQAGRWGLAHLQVIAVENALNRWSATGRVSSAPDLAKAFAAIERANALHPDNPYQLSLQARLLEWRAYTRRGEGDWQGDYRQALALYRQAAALRPLWPDTWAEMIDVKLNLGELDAGLEALMRRADATGPYTPAVHTAIVRGGFALDQQSRGEGVSELLARHLLRGLSDRRSRGRVGELIDHFAQEEAACRSLANAPEPRPKLAICDEG